MSWLPGFPPTITPMPWWGWLAVSLLPDLLVIGSLIWFWLSFRRARTAMHPDGSRSLTEGQTPWAQARETIAVERHRLRATLAGMLDPLALLQPVRDGDGRVVDFIYVDVNPAACIWIGVDREHLLGTQLLRRFREVETSGLMRHLVAVVDTGYPLALDEFPLLRHGAGLRRLDVRGMRVNGWVSLVWRDVTERHDAAEKIAASEEQFRLLAENSLDIVARIDANDKLLWVSPSITPVLGWRAEDWVGRSSLELVAPTEAREVYLRNKARAAAGQGSVARVQLLDAAGNLHWMEVRTSPYRTPDGRINGIMASFRGIDAEVLAEQALERRARIDDLTDLFNRKELLDRLGALLARGARGIAVLWCDIDRFKKINDAHGHAAGDAVLRALGNRLRCSLRTPDDLGARIGGDELMAVLVGVRDVGEAATVAEQLRCSAAEPVPWKGGTLQATLSIGVVLARADEGVDALLARADDAMYRAKEAGRNQVVVIPGPSADRRAAS